MADLEPGANMERYFAGFRGEVAAAAQPRPMPDVYDGGDARRRRARFRTGLLLAMILVLGVVAVMLIRAHAGASIEPTVEPSAGEPLSTPGRQAMGSVTLIFLVMGGVGLGILALSLLLGELFNLVHLPGADTGSWLSLPVVAGFVGALGFAGAIAAEVTPGRTGADWAAALVAGVCAAIPTAWLAARLARAAKGMSTDATPRRADLIGATGVVVSAIPLGGYGEARVTLAGQPVKLNARADRALAAGTSIFVIATPSETSVIVEEISTLLTPRRDMIDPAERSRRTADDV